MKIDVRQLKSRFPDDYGEILDCLYALERAGLCQSRMKEVDKDCYVREFSG